MKKHFLFIAPAVAALVLALGCGSNNVNPPPPPPPPPPPSSTVTELAGLTISHGTMAPAFNAAHKNYGSTLWHNPANFSVTATLRDTKAKLSINGTARNSGQPLAVALDKDGDNVISVKVEAEDGRFVDTTYVTVHRKKLNTNVWVVNGFGGVAVKDAVVALRDAKGDLLDTVQVPASGNLMLGLDKGQKYNIYAKGPESAQASVANFDPVYEDTALLICLNSYVSAMPLEAPIIEDISFGATNNDAGGTTGWLTMPNEETYEGPRANVMAIRVTAISKNPIAPSGSSGFGSTLAPMRVNIDSPATTSFNNSSNSGYAGTSIGANAQAISINGEIFYRTTQRFPLTNLNPNQTVRNHFVDIVVYDNAGNRANQRVYLRIDDSQFGASDTNLSEVKPGWEVIQAQSFGYTVDAPVKNPTNPDDTVNAITPTDPFYGATLQILGQFNFMTTPGGSTRATIRGYEVWHSSDNVNFNKVITCTFATSSTPTASTLFVDRNPTLTLDRQYYKVRVFNGNTASNGSAHGYSLWSDVIDVDPLPPFQAVPAASHEAISMKVWPTFKLTTTHPAMMKKESSDMMNFTIYLKDTHSNYPLFMAPFRVDFSQSGRTIQPGDAWGAGKPVVEFRQITSLTQFTLGGLAGDYGLFQGNWFPARYQDGVVTVTEKDGDGNDIQVDYPNYVAIAWVDDAGNLVIDTDNELFRSASLAFNAASYLHYFGDQLMPGATYEWSIFGPQGGGIYAEMDGRPGTFGPGLLSGTNFQQCAAWGYKGLNAAPFAGNMKATSYGSHLRYGYGSPQGFFKLTIHPDAQ